MPAMRFRDGGGGGEEEGSSSPRAGRHAMARAHLSTFQIPLPQVLPYLSTYLRYLGMYFDDENHNHSSTFLFLFLLSRSLGPHPRTGSCDWSDSLWKSSERFRERDRERRGTCCYNGI